MVIDSADRVQVAQTIINQLGGHKFVIMTGARDILATDAGVQFKLPRARNGINFVSVTLTAMDLYDVLYERRTFSNKTFEYKRVSKASESGLYADMILRSFENVTGLATSL